MADRHHGHMGDERAHKRVVCANEQRRPAGHVSAPTSRRFFLYGDNEKRLSIGAPQSFSSKATPTGRVAFIRKFL